MCIDIYIYIYRERERDVCIMTAACVLQRVQDLSDQFPAHRLVGDRREGAGILIAAPPAVSCSHLYYLSLLMCLYKFGFCVV